MTNYYKINSEDISYRIIEDEAVILNLKTSDYYSLNKTGTFIWKLLENKANLEDIISKFADEFGINIKTATNDIQQLLRDFKRQKLIS